MKCEICHQADATTVLRRKGKDGEAQELFVCKSCADAAHHVPKGKHGIKVEEVLIDGNAEPPPFVQEFLKATLGLMKGFAEQESGAKKASNPDVCPVCGMSWQTAAETRRLGCPECWKMFGSRIRETFLKNAPGARYLGVMPAAQAKTDRAGNERRRLEQQLKRAVKLQKFERAAELRRRLDELQGKGKPDWEGGQSR